jgi:hypothetical protein
MTLGNIGELGVQRLVASCLTTLAGTLHLIDVWSAVVSLGFRASSDGGMSSPAPLLPPSVGDRGGSRIGAKRFLDSHVQTHRDNLLARIVYAQRTTNRFAPFL